MSYLGTHFNGIYHDFNFKNVEKDELILVINRFFNKKGYTNQGLVINKISYNKSARSSNFLPSIFGVSHEMNILFFHEENDLKVRLLNGSIPEFSGFVGGSQLRVEFIEIAKQIQVHFENTFSNSNL